jgi:hypothetical protein
VWIPLLIFSFQLLSVVAHSEDSLQSKEVPKRSVILRDLNLEKINIALDQCKLSEREMEALLMRIRWAASSGLDPEVRSHQVEETASVQNALLPRISEGYEIPLSVLTGFQAKVYEQIQLNINKSSTYFHELQKKDTNLLSQSLNVKVAQLNYLLSQIFVPMDRGLIQFFDSKAITEENIAWHTNYQNAYYIQSTDGAGPLLWTYYLQQKVGGPRHLENDLVKADQESIMLKDFYTYPIHNVKIETRDVSASLDNALFSLEEETQRLRKIDFQKKFETSKEAIQQIKYFMTTYSSAVGQTLLQYPEYSPLVCRALSGLNQDSLDQKEWQRKVDNAALLLTAASVASGGAGLTLRVAGSLFKQPAASLAKWAMGTGAAGSAVSGTDSASQLFGLYDRHREHEKAFISGNADKESLAESTRVLEDLDHAYNNTLMSAGFAVVAGFSMPRFAMIQKYGSIYKAEQAMELEKNTFFRKLTSALNQSQESPLLKDFFASASRNLVSKEEIDLFFVRIADLSFEEQAAIFKNLKNAKDIEQFALGLKQSIKATASRVTTPEKITKKVDTADFQKILADIKRNNLEGLVADLAKEFNITEEVMISRFAQARVTVDEIIKEMEAGTGVFKKVSEGVVSLIKNPALFSEAFRNPKLMAASLLWTFKKRGIVNDEFGKIIAIFVVTSMTTTTFSEKHARGEHFWGQFDIFTKDLIIFGLMEVALVMTGSKTITSAEALMKHVGKARKSPLPTNIFDSVRSGMFTPGQRVLRFGKDGLKLVGISTAITAVGDKIAYHLADDEELNFKIPEEAMDPSVYLVAINSFLFGSSNFRYHLVTKSLAEIERLLAAGKFTELRNLLYYSISIGNDVVGTYTFVKWQEMLKKHFHEKDLNSYFEAMKESVNSLYR